MNVFASKKVQGQRRVFGKPTRVVAAGTAMALLSFIGLTTTAVTASAIAAPTGQGFTVNAADLAFILKQIKIAEAHVANTTSSYRSVRRSRRHRAQPDCQPPRCPRGCGRWTARCNNLQAGQETFGAADQVFPRLTTPGRSRPPSLCPRASARPAQPRTRRRRATSSTREPRTISNLIVDQTSTNPAAVAGGRQPGADPGQRGRRPVHHGSGPTATPPSRSRRLCPSQARPCSSRTSPPTSAFPRPTTPCSPCSVSSSTTAWTRRSRAAERYLFRSRPMIRWSRPGPRLRQRRRPGPATCASWC